MVLAPELIYIALVLVALAMAWFAAKLIEALFGPLQRVVSFIPVVGGSLAYLISTATQAAVNVLGKVEAGCDHLVGGAWHATARIMDKTLNWIHGNSAAVAQIARVVGNLVTPIHALRALAAHLSSVVSSLEHPLRALERKVHGIDRTVKSLERDFTHGIGSDVLPRIKTLERSVARVENKVLPSIEGAESALQNDITNLGEYIRANFLSSATDAVTAAVVVALGALGLGGLRCNSLLSSLKNRGCGLWSGLEDLLGLFVDALILTDLCAILPEAVQFFEFVEGALTGLISQAASAVCALPNQKWTTIDVPAGPRPPAQAFDETTLASGG